ncbi:glycosyltransferase family 4 protein [Bacteroides acidifaciens]|uniref:glycosyltransferase family 4 protein n=1 Tax=Bacteroides acidifaciens TaxID=85831 RepID=UPI00158A8D51|nr:glycosyltransferase family 1 protein [Bacteroides acidifaciens]
MRIGFDGKRAVQNKTGLGNYSRFIIDILSRFHKENQYIIYAPKPKENKVLDCILSRKNIQITYPTSYFWKRFRSLWRIWGINKQIKEEQLSLFHGLSNELPLSIKKSKTKSIVTIHDLIFIRYPQFYKWIDRHIYTYKFKKACQNSNRIIAISEMTKHDIIAFFGIDAHKIDVVYQSCHPIFEQPASSTQKKEIRQKYQLPDKYILNVGSIESRKNLLLVVKALHYIPEDISLVAIGKRTTYTNEVEEYINKHQLNHRVHILHNIPFQELPVFYQLAKLFVYPSFFEGFGIPIIEAIHSNIPVIAATGSCLEEAGGPDSIYINPNNEKELAININKILTSPDLVNKMTTKGKEYIKRFSDETIAQDIMQVYQKTLSATKA